MNDSRASAQDIPQEWAGAYSKLRELERPKKLTPNIWLRIQYNAIALYGSDKATLKAIIASGWSLHDIFGCHYSAPTKRFDCRGLLLAKRHKDKIVEVTNESIKLKKQNSIVQGVYKPLISLPERILLYELF
jgi:hypothetical protein